MARKKATMVSTWKKVILLLLLHLLCMSDAAPSAKNMGFAQSIQAQLEVMKEWSSLTHFRKVWKAITPQYLQTPYELMPRHMQAVIDVEGGHTKY